MVGRKKIRVVCTKCGASGSEKPMRSEAIESWNRENLICCRDCVNYRPLECRCGIYGAVDDNAEAVNRHLPTGQTVFLPDDFCSKADAKPRKN